MIQSQSPSYSHRPQPFSPYGPDYYLAAAAVALGLGVHSPQQSTPCMSFNLSRSQTLLNLTKFIETTGSNICIFK